MSESGKFHEGVYGNWRINRFFHENNFCRRAEDKPQVITISTIFGMVSLLNPSYELVMDWLSLCGMSEEQSKSHIMTFITKEVTA